MPSAGRGPVGQQHMQRLHERERLTPAASSRTSAQPLRTLKSTTAGTLAREGIMASNTPHLGGNTDRRMMENRERSASPRERVRRHQCGGDAATPMGMPSNLPHDAERTLSKRLAKHGVKELAVPLGDGWMQRAGRGSFAVVEETGTRSGPVMQVDSIEPNYYLLTYDQTPDAHIVKTGQYRLEASVRCMPGHTVKEHPYCALVINWQRGRSTITAPCCTALVLVQGCWRLEQYADGQQTTLCEVRDSSLKAGGAFQRVEIEVRGDKIAVSANKRVIIGSFAIPPQTDGSLAAGGRSARAAALTGPCGVAVYRSRAQLRYFEVSPLDGGTEGGGVLGLGGDRPPVPPFTGGDPKLVEAIEGEMLEGVPKVAWDSIGGLADAKRLLNEAVVLPLLIPDYFAKASCRAPWKGVLLFGPPGTGKTLLARAVASLGKTAFFNISASSLSSYHYGESEKLARTLFDIARYYSPSIVFFDEVDALVSTRGAQGEHEASRRLKSELLTQMDGISTRGTSEGQVMVLATSNKPWDLDEAMRRRLERRIYVPLPSEQSRKEMLAIHLRGVKLGPDVDLVALANILGGYSGADLQLVCRDASMAPMRRAVEGKSPMEIVEMQARGELEGAVSMADFAKAMQTTQPSSSDKEHEEYAAWNNLYGCKS
jgi:katanin p60 ATPase-containing subunit A1